MKPVLLSLVSVLVYVGTARAQPPLSASDKARLGEFFETKVRPVLAEHCVSCHGPKKQSAGLRLDSRGAMLKGADDGPIIVPGSPEKSRVVRVLRHEGDIKMPPKGKLPEPVLAALAIWVKDGAYWPEERSAAVKDANPDSKSHWAFQPVRKPGVPSVKQADWPLTAVDHFTLAKLEAKGVAPNPPADRRTLLRRLKHDLLGLPPTYEEVAAFEADAAPDAYAKLVERYLASPQYGERWARHWLDVARYADTKGYVFQEERRYPYAYTYRDYVIRAFNDDLPLDQFIVQQLAADRLVAQGKAEPRVQAAMGYLTLGRRFLNNVHDIIDDRIDVVTRGMLGLSVGCARCHDHKFDPIPIADYYSLYGVFASSTEPKDLPLVGQPEQTKEYREFEEKLKELDRAVADYKAKHQKELEARNRQNLNEVRALQRKVDAFKASSPAAPPRAMVLNDTPRPVEPRVFLRGNPTNPGPSVQRHFLTALTPGKPQPFQDGSGRLELARAIASRDNPLTARVFVNRVWLHHFGAGLVATPSDFGTRSDPPSHPELLDYLASRFKEEGWSVKNLHRQVVLSRTYQLSSAENPRAQDADPENRLLARANRRRLDFEALRDGLLAVAGALDLKPGGPSVDLTKEPFTGRRSVYGFIDRQNLPGVFRTFDFASPDTSSPMRYQTTVPQQALFLLNSPFVLSQARNLLGRGELRGADDPEKVRRLYRLVYARDADADEVQFGLQFLGSGGTPPAAERERSGGSWERYAQVLLVASEFAFVD